MVINLLTSIKNAQQARKETIKVPYSNMDFAVAEILAKYNYLESVSKKGRMPKRVIEIKLKYNSDGKGTINGVKILSKPSRRLYSGYRELKSVKQGYGLGLLSTPKGIMSVNDAKKAKVGGQLLLEVW